MARALTATLLVSGVAFVGPDPAGAVTNPPPFLLKWGTLGTGTTQFDTPSAVAIGPGGEVYTLDSVNNRVQVFTPEGAFLRQIGRTGTGRGQFTNPEGLAVDSEGNVYVSDDGDRVQKFDPTGAWLMRIGLSGSALGRLSDPAGIAVDPADNIYVVDRGNSRVQKFNSETGRFLNAFGVAGGANGQFNAPRSVAVDSDDHVLVADTGNHRVQVFSLFGAFVRSFGGQGSAAGQFQSPGSIAVDSENRVYVADTGNDRMQLLSATGAPLAAWGVTGSGKGKFRGPNGVALDDVDDVYVADGGNHRVQAFGPLPQPDGSIRVGTTGAFAGDNIHNTSGRGQTAAATTAAGRAATYDVTWQNDGVFQERLRLRGTASTARFSVRYTVGGTNVTSAVVAGTYRTPSLAPGATATMRVTVTPAAGASALSATLRGTSVLDSTRIDVVRFVTTRG
ncbi:MAG: 6-bladed beta-propeller [Acidimicrobiales bacterium]|nr:6-bladed beta-propeller [Acidimicrobiales bacterium]